MICTVKRRSKCVFFLFFLQKSKGVNILGYLYVLVSFLGMKEYGENQHIYTCITNSQDKQDEIFYTLEYKKRYVIEIMTKFAKYYYGTDKVINYGKYTENDAHEEEDMEVKHPEYLYTLIQYEWEDILLHIGTWEFMPEVFMRKDIPQLIWLSHGPLPLFVIPARVKKEYQWEQKELVYKQGIIRKFLNEYAMIYSPKWWQAELRNISDQKQSDIDYGKSNGIIEYKDAMFALQNSIINKIYKGTHDKDREKFIKEIENLQKCSREEFINKTNILNRKYCRDEEIMVLEMLNDLVEKDMDEYTQDVDKKTKEHEKKKEMYLNLKLFDVKTHMHNTMKK